eukprot:1131388-Amphidinium_carterae.1
MPCLLLGDQHLLASLGFRCWDGVRLTVPTGWQMCAYCREGVRLAISICWRLCSCCWEIM